MTALYTTGSAADTSVTFGVEVMNADDPTFNGAAATKNCNYKHTNPSRCFGATQAENAAAGMTQLTLGSCLRLHLCLPLLLCLCLCLSLCLSLSLSLSLSFFLSLFLSLCRASRGHGAASGSAAHRPPPTPVALAPHLAVAQA